MAAPPLPMMREEPLDLKRFFEEYQDYLAPRLDMYAQGIYLYLLRHSRLVGRETVVLGVGSARRKMAFGVGEYGKPMSKETCLKKLRDLVRKGCIQLIQVTRQGSVIRVFLPSEIPDVVPPPSLRGREHVERADYFTVPENRLAILRRESYRCFYCLRGIDSASFVIEHVLPRPEGDDSYRNVVAACQSCNSGKSRCPADEFLRTLYREGYLTGEDFESRLKALRLLKRGELRPEM